MFHLTLLLSDILAQTKYIPRALLLTVLIAAGWIYLQEKNSEWRKPAGILKHWRIGLFVLYLCFILMSTVFSRKITNPYRNVLTHFFFRSGDVKWNNEIIENVLFFIPYTVFFLLAFRPKKPWMAALIVSAATTCLVEFSQLILWLGDFQLADMLHNTIGGMIGCAGWQLAQILAEKKRLGKRKEQA